MPDVRRRPGMGAADKNSHEGSDASGSGNDSQRELHDVELAYTKGFGQSKQDRDPYADEALLDGVTKRYTVKYPQQEEGPEDLTREFTAHARKHYNEFKVNVKSYTWFEWVGVFLPCVHWLRVYDWRNNLLYDVAAGLSVGAMVVPQGMSYAKLAGMPNVYGLYGACIPVYIYCILGSSRQLAVGPVAVTSLILGSGIPKTIDAAVQSDPNNPTDPEAQDDYNRAAIQVAFLAGILYTAVGLLRLGWITNFLSHSVISGFITGASVIIGLSQVKLLCGYNTRPNPAYNAKTNPKAPKTVSFPRHDPVHEQLGDILGSDWRPYFRWEEFIMGLSWLALLLAMKHAGRFHRKLTWLRSIGPLTVTVISISMMSIFEWFKPYATPTIRRVGVIPKGMPDQSITHWLPIEKFGEKLLLAIVVCLIDVLESISIAKALAFKNKYELAPTQELRALGIANLFGAAFSCYTTTGSFSRSAVANDTGAKTQIFGITSALLVTVVLLVLTPAFKNMPQNAQGAIVISAVIGLFNWQEGVFLWKVNKFDFINFLVAAIAVMLAGVEKGLAIAIGLSVLIVLYKSAFPHSAILGRLPQTQIYRNVKQYPEARVLENILCMRIDAPIYFANVHVLRARIAKYEARADEYARSRGTRLRFTIIDLSPVTDIDASGIHWLKDWIVDHKERGIQPVFANPSRSVVRLLEKAHLPKLIGEEFICVRVHDAVLYCQELLAEEAGLKPPHDSPKVQSFQPVVV